MNLIFVLLHSSCERNKIDPDQGIVPNVGLGQSHVTLSQLFAHVDDFEVTFEGLLAKLVQNVLFEVANCQNSGKHSQFESKMLSLASDSDLNA